MSYGLTTANDYADSIDEHYASMAFKGKSISTADASHHHYIKSDDDEVVVIRPLTQNVILICGQYIRNGNSGTYQIYQKAVTDIHLQSSQIQGYPTERKEYNQLEIFRFKAPIAETNKYGINIFNNAGNLIFSSNEKYLKPAYNLGFGDSYQTPSSITIPNGAKLGVIVKYSPLCFINHIGYSCYNAIWFKGNTIYSIPIYEYQNASRIRASPNVLQISTLVELTNL